MAAHLLRRTRKVCPAKRRRRRRGGGRKERNVEQLTNGFALAVVVALHTIKSSNYGSGAKFTVDTATSNIHQNL